MSRPKRESGALAVLLTFLRLGCTSFGGPVAHLGFFREELVQRRGWVTEAEYADLVALCQFLPGPASSQVGFALGLRRAGLAGAFAAWLGFTLPSAVAMTAFALGLGALGDLAGAGWLVGLKLAAVAVVAQALWGMAEKLCPDRGRALLALGAAGLLLLLDHPLGQVGVILVGAMAGWWWYRGAAGTEGVGPREPLRPGWPYLVVFALLLLGLPVLAAAAAWEGLAVVDAFYRAGSLVFGGGHVVLPLLEAWTVAPGWVDRETFLAGYGAAQAMPGPLFTFTAFLGASLNLGPAGWAGAALALVATFLPSWLLVLGALPSWDRLRRRPDAQAALLGANAAVVGLLLAALYDPVWVVAVTGPERLAFVLVAFGLLRFARLPPWALVVGSAAVGAAVLG